MLLARRLTVKIYPNPAVEQANIQLPADFERATITVFDVQGRQVLTQSLNAGQVQQSVQVSDWPAGMYLLQIQVDSHSSTQKLQVNRD